MTLIFFITVTTSTYASDQFDGHNVYVVDQGQGPVIVLIHGLGADSTRWQANIDVLAKTNRVIAIDLLGFGRSDKPDVAYRMQLYVSQIAEVLHARDIEKATLIGNSMGGLVALLFAEKYSERTTALTLVAPAFVFGLPSNVSADRLASGASPKTPAAMRAYLERIYHEPDLSPDSIAIALTEKEAVNDTATIKSVAESLVSGEDILTRDRLRRITASTLIIHGSSDGVVPVSRSRLITELLPNAELVVRRNVGHWPQLEDAEYFNKSILKWLNTKVK